MTGEDWDHTNKTTVEVTVQSGQIKSFINPETVKSEYYRHLLTGPDKPECTREMENESGRLFQGIRYIKVPDTCFFIHRHKVPQDKNVNHSHIVCNIMPQNKETHRV